MVLNNLQHPRWGEVVHPQQKAAPKGDSKAFVALKVGQQIEQAEAQFIASCSLYFERIMALTGKAPFYCSWA